MPPCSTFALLPPSPRCRAEGSSIAQLAAVTRPRRMLEIRMPPFLPPVSALAPPGI